VKRSATDPILIASLATGASYPVAATAAGVSERTVRRRLADPVFAGRVEQERAVFIERTAAQLLAGTTVAVETLRELAQTGPPAVRVRAALGLLSATTSWRETYEVDQRLAALESMADDTSRQGDRRDV
jgi:hypothetical protein